MKHLLVNLLVLAAWLPVSAEERTINIEGGSTSSSYATYSDYIWLPEEDIVNVKMPRYCYFNPTIDGNGVLNLYAGGERCYLGTKNAWPNWWGFSGDIHIFPFKDNFPSAGYFGVVMSHGGKSFSPETMDYGQANTRMYNNRVTLHQGATMCCEANNSGAGAGFQIGELQTEEGSTLTGYYKKSRGAYYILGCSGSDATLAGKIAPTDYDDATMLGIIKEGAGTYTITGNDNYLSGALRILQGRVLVMNDRAKTESSKLRGALGAKANASDPVAYVFGQGVLGGTGSIGGKVDNYGTIEPGADGIGLLTLKNYKAQKNANLCMRPASVLRMEVASADSYDRLTVDGQVEYNNKLEDFSPSDKMPVIEVVVLDDANVKVGDELHVLTAKSKADEWHFDVKANHYTWEVEERMEDDLLVFVLRLVSLDDMGGGDNPDDPNKPESTMGAFYDDGIDDAEDQNTLQYYAALNNKNIGTAISLWKNDLTNPDLGETKEVGWQFNMLVAENEMKPDALQPSQGEFNFGAADALVDFAMQHDMAVRGHCLVWHAQQPTWISSDGKKNDKNWTRDQALEIMKNHITTVMQHYRGKVREWDVVNECLDDDQSIVRTDPNGYSLRKQSVWRLAISDDYVDSAFVYAHRADPDALLFLNDYDVELQGTAKSEAFYNLAMRLKSKNIPIDGVGLQCHFDTSDVDSLKLDNTIRRFGEAGLQCIMTELDMGIPSTSEENLLEQARCYRVVTDIMLSHDNCPSMVIWGLKDNNSWREASNPLLYTAQLYRKPAWYAVRSALRHRTLGDTSVQPVRHTGTTVSTRYNLSGQKVNANYKGIVIVNGQKVVF